MITALVNSVIIAIALWIAVNIHDNVENEFTKDILPILACLAMGFLTSLT